MKVTLHLEGSATEMVEQCEQFCAALSTGEAPKPKKGRKPKPVEAEEEPEEEEEPAEEEEGVEEEEPEQEEEEEQEEEAEEETTSADVVKAFRAYAEKKGIPAAKKILATFKDAKGELIKASKDLKPKQFAAALKAIGKK